jgi:xanthine dehydrogenase YagS FAD-binding subunit
MQPFSYARLDSVEDATAASLPGTMFLAGGTELLNWLRLGIANPEHLLDISRIPGLDRIEPLPAGEDGVAGLRIGATVRLNDAALHAAVVRDYPVLSQAILQSASAQLRNLATIGGNPVQRTRCAYFRSPEPAPCNKRRPGSGCAALDGLNERHAIFGWTEDCVATQPSDPATALAALDAVIVTEAAEGGRRIPAREFHTLPAERPEGHNLLAMGELITAIELPAPAPRSAYVKVRERSSYEYAIVSAAAAVEHDGEVLTRVRLALGSVAHRPWRLDEAEAAMRGLPLGSPRIAEVLDEAFRAARPLSRNACKVPLARNAALRAIETAARKA